MKPITALLATLLALLQSESEIGAQEQILPGTKEPAPPPRFFDRPVDYWQSGLSYETDGRKGQEAKPGQAKPPGGAGRSEWTQVVRQQDGSYAYHDLPRPLVDVLEDPSPDKIRAYFEWKLARTQKILRAAEAMKEYRRVQMPKQAMGGEPGQGSAEERGAEGAARELPRAAPTLAPAASGPGASSEAFTVTYFHRAGCRHCDTQDGVLAGWLKDKPQGKLEIVEFGDKPELWRRFGVRGSPSLVIDSGASRKPVFLEGLSREPVLEEALRRSREPQPEGSTSKEGDKK